MGFKTVSTRGNFSRREINIVWLYCGLATLLFVNQFGETSRTSQYGYLKQVMIPVTLISALPGSLPVSARTFRRLLEGVILHLYSRPTRQRRRLA